MVPVCSRGDVKVKLRARSRFPDKQHAQWHNCRKQRGDKRYREERESAQQGIVNEREHEHGNYWRDRHVRDEDRPSTFFTVSGRNATVIHPHSFRPVSYTHLRAHETDSYLVCRLLLEKKKKIIHYNV